MYVKDAIKIIILCCMLFGAGYYFGRSHVPPAPDNPAKPDTVSIYAPPDTVYIPGKIRYITRIDTLYQDTLYIESYVQDSVASFDTTFADSGRIAVDYFINLNRFTLYRQPPPEKYITKYISKYAVPEFKWYDGFGISAGYDPINKSASITIGYGINIGNIKQMIGSRK